MKRSNIRTNDNRFLFGCYFQHPDTTSKIMLLYWCYKWYVFIWTTTYTSALKIVPFVKCMEAPLFSSSQLYNARALLIRKHSHLNRIKRYDLWYKSSLLSASKYKYTVKKNAKRDYTPSIWTNERSLNTLDKEEKAHIHIHLLLFLL